MSLKKARRRKKKATSTHKIERASKMFQLSLVKYLEPLRGEGG